MILRPATFLPYSYSLPSLPKKINKLARSLSGSRRGGGVVELPGSVVVETRTAPRHGDEILEFVLDLHPS